MITPFWQLENSIYLLNDFCADSKTFSYRKLTALKLKGLNLQVKTEQRELLIVVSTESDYQTLQGHLIPSQRLYQLLGIHFKKVHLMFGRIDEPVEKSLYLNTILLTNSSRTIYLRDEESLGSRLRRALNIALHGHIGILKLRNDEELNYLNRLWKRQRITQLVEKYSITLWHDSSNNLVKLSTSGSEEGVEQMIITID